MHRKWKKSKLEDIAEIVGGGTPSRNNPEFWNGNIPWATPTDITSNKNRMLLTTKEYITEKGLVKSSTKLLPSGTVLMTSRATIGECAINLIPMATNQGFANFICRDIALNKFVYYLLTYFKSDFEKLGSGSTFKEISKKVLKSFIIMLPPIQEQDKIASILTTVDEAIEKTQAIIETTEKVKKGLMQQLLTKGIGHTMFKNTVIGEIPEGWEVKELADVAKSNERYSFTGGPFGSDLTSKEYTQNGVQIIQLQNIGEGFFNNNYKIFTSEEKADELASCNIFPEDIIIAKMAEPVARACIVPNHAQRYVMASDGIRLAVDKNRYNTQFVKYSINSPYFRKQAIVKSTGTTRLRIGLKTLRQLKILMPPIGEQNDIAEIFSTIDKKIDQERYKLEKLQIIKNGLMQDLLTGKIRVNVDEEEVATS